MNLTQLSLGLAQAFFTENHRIVFWYDPQGDFKADLTSLDLDNVNIVDMATESALGIKLKLELEDTQGKYLLYFPSPEPAPEKDWLLDIKLYSRSFYADRFSIIFNDLGLQQQSLREHLALREKFFASKARLSALKKFVQADMTELELDLAMICVITKADSCDLTHILFALAEQSVESDTGLEVNPKAMDELEKFALIPAFLTSLQLEVGYPYSKEELSAEKPFMFGHCLIRLLATGFCESVGEVPPWAKDLAISAANARATSRALLSRWRDSSRYYKSFDVVSGWVADALRIEEKLESFNYASLLDVATFESVERSIIIELAHAIPQASVADLNQFSDAITARLDGYWASRHKDDDKRRKYRSVYRALASAIDLYRRRQAYSSGLHFSNLEEIYKAYETDLYRFDQSYRQYWAASQRAQVEILKKLDDQVEQCYANWFIDNLAKAWGDRVEAEGSLANWRIAGVGSQQQFFTKHVAPVLSKSPKQRIVVIISDAFRYEAAVELTDRINEKRYSEATISSQLGVVPSYTTLGMASLLPHKTLQYKEGVADDVFVDGQSSKGTAARNKVLAAHQGIAVTAEQVKQWSRDEGRDALRDQQLVYVYHNVVDARGDSASTESETFMAVEHAIDELTELTRKILMHFNTSTVLITADHGFLFQQSKLELADRTALTEKPANIIKSKKRYLIGNDLPANTDVWVGSTKDTAGTDCDTEFWVPKGANRFHFVGGARFVHGGVMPQEIVVPVVRVKQLRGAKAEKRTKRKVGVICAKSSLKMVNNIQRFDLMQTEAVSDQVLPVTVSVAIYDGDTKVSSEEGVTFDCTTDSVAERVKQIRLSLSGSDFDRNKDYFLIIKDKDLNTEIERYKVTIDLAFTDDFF
ncbi:MAG: hypothetical protein OFPII_05850 [Osedax symbiont Rs1]|nr:MAG: hypothetical protein OFPII_05850 [Osedax symbiont Rs1]